MQPPPFEAYAGNQPYIFISYAHRDAEQVFPIIDQWYRAGYRLWYDEGIDPGNEWPEEVANALEGCIQFFVFISPRSVLSKNVKNEISFAIDLEKDFIAIHLEETPLPPGLRLRMGDIQAIMRHRMPAGMFDSKMEKVLASSTLEKSHSPSAGTPLPVNESPTVTPSEPATLQKSLDPERKIGTDIGPATFSETDTPNTRLSRQEPGEGKPPNLQKNIKDRLHQRKYSQMTPAEMKKAAVEDFNFIKGGLTDLVKKEWNAQKNRSEAHKKQADERRRKAKERKLQLAEGKQLKKEIQLEIEKDRKQKLPRRRKGCGIRIPFSFIIIAGLIYFFVFNDTYSSLSEDFLDTECPNVYTQTEKMQLIDQYERSLKGIRRKQALSLEIEKCELKGAETDRIQTLGLDTMTVAELEAYYLANISDTGSKRAKWFKKYLTSNLNIYTMTANMDPDAQEFVIDLAEDPYRSFLIKMIMTGLDDQPADSRSRKKPGQ